MILRLSLLSTVLLVTMANPSFADRKIMVGPHIGNATIVSLRGVNSDKAVVTFRREFEDELETCLRETRQSPTKCKDEAKVSLNARITERSAYCSRATIYTEFGNFSMVHHEIEVSKYDGMTNRLVRTDWKDHKTEKLVGNCNACNTPVMIDTYRVLCPKWYDDVAKDGELY